MDVEILLAVAVLWVLLLAAKPFPHWPAWFRIFGQVLGNWSIPAFTLRARARQLGALLFHAVLLGPLWTVLWWLDELLYPAYRRTRIEAPVFLVSQPRCGTTFLHRTLAEHEGVVAVRMYEWKYPFLAVQKLLAWVDRVSSGRVSGLDYFRGEAAGAAARMHRQRWGDYEEDGVFFEYGPLVHLFTLLRHPWPALFDPFDRVSRLSPRARRRMLEAHRKALQKVLYLRGKGRTLVLKENESWERLPEWLAMYPDARFVTMTREVGSWMPSLYLLARWSTLSKTGVDPWRIPGWAEALTRVKLRDTERMAAFFEETLRQGGNLQLRIAFDLYVRSLGPCLEHVLGQLGLEMTPAFRAHVQALEEKQPGVAPGKHEEGLDDDLAAAWERWSRDFTTYARFHQSVGRAGVYTERAGDPAAFGALSGLGGFGSDRR